MNVVKLMGGLGNQLFQYAFGQHVREVTGKPVGYNLEWFDKPTIPVRPYCLDKFNMTVPASLFSRTRKIDERSCPPLSKNIDNMFFQGYWQDPRYYDEVLIERLRNEFHVPDKFWTVEFIKWYELIKSCDNAIALHVRRGDYMNHPRHLVLPFQYYNNALAYIAVIKTDPEVFIFSDDIQWCKEQFDGVHFIELAEDYLEFELMRACKHFIIANSTFSWWAAFLAYNATVIAPNQWAKDRRDRAVIHERKILDNNWLKISLS